jgi:hypothetical protein
LGEYCAQIRLELPKSNKRIINGSPFTWNPTIKRWVKDNKPPSGLTAGTPGPAQPPGKDPTRRTSGNPFPPSSIGADDASQVSDNVSQAEIASLQLQLANLMNNVSTMVNKIGPP